MRTNYVLIDFENVRPETLDLLAGEHFKVLVFVGAKQDKIPFEMAAALQRLGVRAEYVKISGSGANALDFHIAFYIGLLAASDPTAYFHVISKDTGFDPLIEHLNAGKRSVRRSASIAEIPPVRVAMMRTPEERIEFVLARLRQMNGAKPQSVQTLSSTIARLFYLRLTEEEISAVVRGLATRGYVAVEGAGVTYTLPGEA